MVRPSIKCWTNIHPHQLNVFDFTFWASYENGAHPGISFSRNPITEIAEAGKVRLPFPPWHQMWRWYENKSKLKWVGKFGDSVNYIDLPSELKEDLESIFDLFTGGDGIDNSDQNNIMCGSPGEIANDHSSIEAFDEINRHNVVKPYPFFHKRYFMQRKEVWTEIVLGAPDQLRQRMAW